METKKSCVEVKAVNQGLLLSCAGDALATILTSAMFSALLSSAQVSFIILLFYLQEKKSYFIIILKKILYRLFGLLVIWKFFFLFLYFYNLHWHIPKIKIDFFFLEIMHIFFSLCGAQHKLEISIFTKKKNLEISILFVYCFLGTEIEHRYLGCEIDWVWVPVGPLWII